MGVNLEGVAQSRTPWRHPSFTGALAGAALIF
jgi:hypothetical protein